jgi:cobalt/nickel transport system permease protein
LIRPDLIEQTGAADRSLAGRWGQVLVGGLAISIAVAVFLAPFASEHSDGLEWVGDKFGFLKEEPPVLGAPIPDYQLTLPGVQHVKVATAVAGLIGTLVVFATGFILAGIFTRRSPAIADSVPVSDGGPVPPI